MLLLTPRSASHSFTAVLVDNVRATGRTAASPRPEVHQVVPLRLLWPELQRLALPLCSFERGVTAPARRI